MTSIITRKKDLQVISNNAYNNLIIAICIPIANKSTGNKLILLEI